MKSAKSASSGSWNKNWICNFFFACWEGECEGSSRFLFMPRADIFLHVTNKKIGKRRPVAINFRCSVAYFKAIGSICKEISTSFCPHSNQIIQSESNYLLKTLHKRMIQRRCIRKSCNITMDYNGIYVTTHGNVSSSILVYG